MLWHWDQQDGSKVSTLSFAHNCPCWGAPEAWHCISKEEFWIAIQASQGLLTSGFFCSWGFHTHSTLEKKGAWQDCVLAADRRHLYGGSHRKPLSPYQLHFQGKILQCFNPISWWKAAKHLMKEHEALLAASFLFTNRAVLIWFYSHRKEAEGSCFSWVSSGSLWTVVPKVFPAPEPAAISSRHLSVKLHRFISSVTAFFICFSFLQHISEA